MMSMPASTASRSVADTGDVATSVGAVVSVAAVAEPSVISDSARFDGAWATPSRPKSMLDTVSIDSVPSANVTVPAAWMPSTVCASTALPVGSVA